MSAKAQHGMVIFRQWDRHTGLIETEAGFITLDELFTLCLQGNDPMFIDRVTIEGEDENGASRTVTLVFQSVTMPEWDGSES